MRTTVSLLAAVAAMLVMGATGRAESVAQMVSSLAQVDQASIARVMEQEILQQHEVPYFKVFVEGQGSLSMLRGAFYGDRAGAHVDEIAEYEIPEGTYDVLVASPVSGHDPYDPTGRTPEKNPQREANARAYATHNTTHVLQDGREIATAPHGQGQREVFVAFARARMTVRRGARTRLEMAQSHPDGRRTSQDFRSGREVHFNGK